MGCLRKHVIEHSEMPVGTAPITVDTVPANACEGQMDFLNVSNTTLYIRFAMTTGSTQLNSTLYSIKLFPGDAYSHDGLIPGTILALSSGAGGKLSTLIAYRALGD